MKKIDWKEVALDPDLAKKFTIEVFNKFQTLSPDPVAVDNVEDIYSNLVKTTHFHFHFHFHFHCPRKR